MRYIAIYKDDANARNRYFGPFVSQTVTEEFLNDLPEPLPGGIKTWKPLGVHGSDARLATDEILSNRVNNPITSTAVARIQVRDDRVIRNVRRLIAA